MKLKISFGALALGLGLAGGLSSASAADEQSTDKTCGGTVWFTIGDRSAPMDMQFKLVRAAGSDIGNFTMSFLEMSIAGTYTVTNEKHVEANFQASHDDMITKGKFHLVSDTAIGVSGTMSGEGKEEVIFFATDLKCSNNP